MKFLLAYLKLLPVVLPAIIAIEGAVSAPGATKKDIIMAGIQAGTDVGSAVPNETVQALSATIDLTVKALNAAGVFKTSAGIAK